MPWTKVQHTCYYDMSLNVFLLQVFVANLIVNIRLNISPVEAHQGDGVGGEN